MAAGMQRLASALPQVASGAVAALNCLYAHNQELYFDADGGKYALRWHYGAIDFTPQIILEVSVGGLKGQLALERLGGIFDSQGIEMLDSPLREAMLVQTFSATLDRLQAACGLSVEVALPRPGPTQDAATVVLFALNNLTSGASTRGYLKFADGAGWEMLAQSCARAASTLKSDWGHSGVVLRFEIGATQLTRKEYAQLDAGDWLLIETARSASGALLVAARIPGAARTLCGNAVGTDLTIMEVKRTMRGDSSEVLADTASGIEEFESVMLEIRFDVGEQSCALSELQSIQPGHVFRLGVPIETAPVQLRIGGRLVGRGQLVAVGDQLGVRLVEISAQRG